ncbi:hypothetical protein EG68_11331 [Paragonimus skrjabini miyazakii]|uniref:Uncharacterized protein n=1 Tax=Paragonimus skrjabini miyazakii TaxID=59628 RepID=A0A8S9YEQ5_9TREM|nr:hypothetical protein EG68_11331 [Paragonimus skrjabini miyazakii]
MNGKEVNLTNILPQYNNSKSIQLLLTSEMLLESAAQILLSKNEKDDLLATENIPEAVQTIVSSCSYQRTLEDLKDRIQQQLSTAAPEDIRQLTFMLNQPLRTTEILDCERGVVICSTSCMKMQSGSTEQEQHEELRGCRGRTSSPTESPTHSSSSSEGSSGTLCATRSTYRAKSPNVLAREINQINITGGMQHSVPIQQAIPLHEHTALRDRFAKTHQVTQSFSDAESSFSSCLNQDSGTVLNQDLLVAMASALDKRKSSLSIRQQTLRQLVHLPIIDVQACEAWTSSMRPDLTNVPVSDTWESVWSSEARLEGKPKSLGTGKVHIVSTTTEVGKRTENTQNFQFHQTGDLRDSKSQSCSFNAGLRDGLADALNDEDEMLWV